MYSLSSSGLAARKRKAKKEEVKDEGSDAPKVTSALLRIQKDFADLEIPDSVELKKEDEMNYSFVLQPQSGYWKGGIFEFKFSFPEDYPFHGPKVSLLDKIYHPNIDLDGGVCVNVLRPWKPTYSTQIVLFGLLFLFTHPNPNDPLNQEAAAEMRENPQAFARNVINAMKGLKVGGTTFPKNRGKEFQ
jgi:ubiquitin-conjugating enzyme E2 M